MTSVKSLNDTCRNLMGLLSLSGVGLDLCRLPKLKILAPISNFNNFGQFFKTQETKNGFFQKSTI